MTGARVAMIRYEQHGVAGLYLGRSTPVVDERGSFERVFDAEALQAGGGPALSWVELNQSRSCRAMIRGLHLRRDLRQWKQIRVIRGAIFDVVVDLRPASATYRRALTVELSVTGTGQVIIPPGCAHGFQALSDDTEVAFTSSVPSVPSLDTGFRFDDPAFDIDWPIRPPVLSDRDAALGSFDAMAPELARVFGADPVRRT